MWSGMSALMGGPGLEDSRELLFQASNGLWGGLYKGSDTPNLPKMKPNEGSTRLDSF